MENIVHVIISLGCIIAFIIYGYFQKTVIRKYLQKQSFLIKLLYPYAAMAVFVVVVYYSGKFFGEVGFLIPFVCYVFSRILLYYSHVFWHHQNGISRQILEENFNDGDKHDVLSKSWSTGFYSFCNERYIADIEPFGISIIRWDQITEIYGFEDDAYTTTMTVLEFRYSNGKAFIVTDFNENFNSITDMMEKKFPMISKEWPNYVFHGGGNVVSLYSYESQVY